MTMTISFKNDMAELDISDVSQDEDLLVTTKTGDFKITSNGEVFFYRKNQSYGDVIHCNGQRM